MFALDTIAAIATPPGEGGLAVVRVSGPQALEVADRAFSPAGKRALKPSLAPSHTLHFGHIVHNRRRVDEVLLAVMRAPRTFTREDVIEITCHGGAIPAKLVLDTVLQNGARLAQPGEFTKRAFLNGRIDLAQAEAVADVIQSRTELALRAANEQLTGKLSERIKAVREVMLQTLAHIEAHIDFPEEDIAPDTRAQIINRLDSGVGLIEQLLRTADEGQILRQGLRVAIIGRPNAGKSSLLNQLLGKNRAIVSPIAGTTRDTIEEIANIRGLPVIFIDTAGLREAGDEIEIEGIRRSRQTLERAEVILHVFDSSEALTDADEKYLKEFAGKKRILVLNKADLPRRFHLPSRSATFKDQFASNLIETSCLTGEGIDQLKDRLKEMVWSGKISPELVEVTVNSRHQDALNRCRTAASRTIDALRQGATLELVALDLRIAVNAVGEIIGETTTEDLLDKIFSQFCIGK